MQYDYSSCEMVAGYIRASPEQLIVVCPVCLILDGDDDNSIMAQSAS